MSIRPILDQLQTNIPFAMSKKSRQAPIQKKKIQSLPIRVNRNNDDDDDDVDDNVTLKKSSNMKMMNKNFRSSAFANNDDDDVASEKSGMKQQYKQAKTVSQVKDSFVEDDDEYYNSNLKQKV